MLVLGWAVRGADREPETHLRVGGRRFWPVVAFSRPDVIEYLVHTGAVGVGADDLADSFVLAGPAAPGAGRLSVRGHVAQLAEAAPAEDAAAVLDRYADALAPLQSSPATDFARRRLAALRPGRHPGRGSRTHGGRPARCVRAAGAGIRARRRAGRRGAGAVRRPPARQRADPRAACDAGGTARARLQYGAGQLPSGGRGRSGGAARRDSQLVSSPAPTTGATLPPGC